MADFSGCRFAVHNVGRRQEEDQFWLAGVSFPQSPLSEFYTVDPDYAA